MAGETRRATVRALAKINLSLEVLGKRADGYHDIRTLFQTISLADRLELEFTPSRVSKIELTSSVDIPNNLVVRAAETVFRAAQRGGLLRMRLIKKIPMGGGLGGGSTDAAAVLLALPALLGRALPLDALLDSAAALGSDVPFLLVGGTALGLGRGTELYPLEEAAAEHVVVVAPGVHVSTAEAYAGLGRSLTLPDSLPKINSSQTLAQAISRDRSVQVWGRYCNNDFEPVVFREHPRLGAIKRKLKQAGASAAMMTGSGAAVFGIFETKSSAETAMKSIHREQMHLVSFVSRGRYQALWRRQLAEHIQPNTWPPLSRFAQ